MDNTDPNNPNQNPPGDAFPPSAVTPPANPWDPPVTQTPEASTIPLPNATNVVTNTPAQTSAAPDSTWPSSTGSNPGFGNPASPPSAQGTQPITAPELNMNQNPSNPFMQPQTPIATPPPTDPNIFAQNQNTQSTGISHFGTEQSAAQNSENSTPATNPSPPTQSSQQDPLNTAFAPDAHQNQPNPFGNTEQHTEAPPQQPSTPPITSNIQNDNPITDNPQNSIPDQPQSGLPINPPANQNPSQEELNPQIPGSNQPGTLDLSQLQNTPAPAEGTPAAQPPSRTTALPEMGSTENAPTDLSHLIAGDEQHQQPGDIYTPPVASDQNPTVNGNQSQAAPENGTPPPGKHLNLTKVLLVAGIPIILIVAAISAYMILGIGKTAPQSDTNTTTEQTDAQAPLTNPPQQIEAPTPETIPEPSPSPVTVEVVESTTSGTTLPAASSSPMSAIEQLKARQAAAASSSPVASSTP